MRHAAPWILLVLALWPFAATRHAPHVHDDHDFRGPGSLVADARADLGVLWRADVFGHFERPTGHSGFWRPLLLLGFRVEHALTEGRPLPYAWLGHVVTLLLHALATLALWKLLMALGLAWSPAFVAAALFAVHPVHVESVAWISGRTDVLPALLAWLGTAWLLTARERRGLWLAGAALLAAPLAKESGVLLVGLAGVLAWVAARAPSGAGFPGRRPLHGAWWVPGLALLAYGLLRSVSFEHGLDPAAYTGPEDLASRWGTWLSILPDLVRLSLWPGPATPLHPVQAVQGWGETRVVVGALVLAVLLVGSLAAWRRRSPLAVWAWSLPAGTCLLLAPWVRFPLGYAEVAAPLYERHLYAAAAVPCVALAWLARAWLQRHPAAALALGVTVALAIAPVTRERSRVWSSDEAFARAAVTRIPQSAALWNHLGWALMPAALQPDGDAAAIEAVGAFERAASLEPDDLEPRLNRFILMAQLGREEAAEVAAHELLAAHPDEPAVLDNVATWHLSRGRWEAGVVLLERELATGRALPGALQALNLARDELDRAAVTPDG